MAPKKFPVESYSGDEVITVTMSREDYETLRNMIAKEKSLSWIGKYMRNVLFVFAGGILTIIAFYHQIETGFKALVRSIIGG